MYRGIDVSSNNGVLDWDKIKGSGVDFAIIRLGYGSDIEDQDDSQAERNMKECERLGIPYGVYIYSYALSTDEAVSESAHALRMMRGYKPKVGVWFDQEDADNYKARHGINVYEQRQLITDICKTFCEAMNRAGFECGIYANKNYWDNVLYQDQLGYPVWLAHWGINEPSMECRLWQYSSDGVVDGSSERTDMNYLYSELPAVDPEPVSDPQPDTVYHVGDEVSYDTIYTSSDSDQGLTPTYTSGTITRVIAGARNPYLINDGTGWVNDGAINGSDQGADTGAITVGANCMIREGAVQYDSESTFADWVYSTQYTVIQVNGDRVVFGIDGVVTGDTDSGNIILC